MALEVVLVLESVRKIRFGSSVSEGRQPFSPSSNELGTARNEFGFPVTSQQHRSAGEISRGAINVLTLGVILLAIAVFGGGLLSAFLHGRLAVPR
jgi:hypothetical protein